MAVELAPPRTTGITEPGNVTDDTLTDPTQQWIPGVWTNWTLWYIGRRFTIAENTAQSLTIEIPPGITLLETPPPAPYYILPGVVPDWAARLWTGWAFPLQMPAPARPVVLVIPDEMVGDVLAILRQGMAAGNPDSATWNMLDQWCAVEEAALWAKTHP